MRNSFFKYAVLLFSILFIIFIQCKLDNNDEIPIPSSLEDFEQFVEDTLRMWPNYSNGVLTIDNLLGLNVSINKKEESITLYFIDNNSQEIENPIILIPYADSTNSRVMLIAEDVSFLDYSELTFIVQIDTFVVGSPEISILIASNEILKSSLPKTFHKEIEWSNVFDNRSRRLKFVDRFNKLRQKEGFTVLDAYACTMQNIVDANIDEFGTDLDFWWQDSKNMIIDDIIDVFIPASWETTKWATLFSSPEIGESQGIGEPKLTGFNSTFSSGEGRFRHFAANLGAARVDPFLIVANIAGRVIGGDYPWSSDPNGDIAADIATNVVGQEFYGELSDLYDELTNPNSSNRIDDGTSVRDWIHEKFGDGSGRDDCDIPGDKDNDGILDDDDNCPEIANEDQEDADEDGVGDECDNCPDTENEDQEDQDNDNVGDDCDNCPQSENPDQKDTDDDGYGDECDNCPEVANEDQEDQDNDFVGDDCDNCPDIENQDQLNSDDDSYGDDCDNCPEDDNEDQADTDEDGVGDECDNCPDTENEDQLNSDGDSHGDACDNCPNDDNEDQADSDEDGTGDACEESEPEEIATCTGVSHHSGYSVIKVCIKYGYAEGHTVDIALSGPSPGAASVTVVNGEACAEFTINSYGDYTWTAQLDPGGVQSEGSITVGSADVPCTY